MPGRSGPTRRLRGLVLVVAGIVTAVVFGLGCASSSSSGASSAVIPEALPAVAAVPRDLHVDVTLVGGERIPGSGADQMITFFTREGRSVIPLSSVRAIDANGDQETVTVRTADAIERRGVLETETIELVATGSTVPRVIDVADVQALRVTPRIRIAGSGDAWWEVSFVHAHGFEVENDDGRLTVRNIDPAVMNAGSHGPWSTVNLSRDIDPLVDFELEARMAWDADGAGRYAMQNLFVTLFDAEGTEIVSAGHHDAWTGSTGSRYSRVSDVQQESGYGTQPATGCADVRIVREGGRLRVLWDGDEVRAHAAPAAIVRVVVQVDFYAYRGSYGESVFGTASLDRLEIRAPSAVAKTGGTK